jgi:hypothetical protein
MSARCNELRALCFLSVALFHPASSKLIDSSLLHGMLSAMPFEVQAATKTRLIEPSLWYCLIGLPFLVLGGVGYHFALLRGTQRAVDSFTRLVIPGQVEVSLGMGQKLIIFFENGSLESGVPYSSPASLDGLRCDLRDIFTGTSFQARASNLFLTYQFQGRSGQAVLEFLSPGDGLYLITCTSPAAENGHKAVLELGVGVVQMFSRVVFESYLAVGAGVVAALIPFLVAIFKRDRSRRRIRSAGFTPV